MPDTATNYTVPAASRTGLINNPLTRLTVPQTGDAITPLTQGQQAAQGIGSGVPQGSAYKYIKMSGDPLKLGLPNPLQVFPGALFKKNRPAIGDISAALAAGQPITDEQWAKAGYGPGGTNLLTNPVKPIVGVDTNAPGFKAAAAAGPRSGHGNASPLQDIYGAIAAGTPVSDASWRMAGYGPGGTDLSADAPPSPVTAAGRSGLFGVPAAVLASRTQAPAAPATAPATVSAVPTARTFGRV